jgi:predicted RNase H-like HicB family nuclease
MWRWRFETSQTEGETTPATMTTATPQRLTAILYREGEVYVAECPEVGTASQGDTIEEALANLREATELYLEECPQPALAPRLLTTFEVNVA